MRGLGNPHLLGRAGTHASLGLCVCARLLVPALLAQGIAGPAQRTVVGALGLTLNSPALNKLSTVSGTQQASDLSTLILFLEL